MSTFAWNGQILEYFDHPYNHTALNTRRVEVPIARWFLAQAPAGARLLEIGNVLAHYGSVPWPVVDMHEKGCVNVDVMTWSPPQPVDYLVSISTLEHIGFGKYRGDLPAYAPVAVWDRLLSFLAPGGRMLATVPLCYNPALDDALVTGILYLEQSWYMRHVRENDWEECAIGAALAESNRACAGRWPGGLAILYAEAL